MDYLLDYIRRACHSVNMLQHAANWQWKGMPVLQFEFHDMNEFMEAEYTLLQATKNELYFAGDKVRNVVDDRTIDFRIYGVTFRLVCHQEWMTPTGPIGIGNLR